MRRPFALVLAALAALSLWMPAAGAEEALTVVSTDVAAYPDVHLVVTAPGRAGAQPVPSSAFSVREAGQARPVTVEAQPVASLEVALVIDTSGSMSGPALTAAKTAAASFLSQLPETAAVSVIAFDAKPSVVSPRSTNRKAQVAAVNSLSAAGSSALYDALARSLTELGSGGRRAVVLLSDGGDKSSAATLDGTAAALTGAGATLYAIELVTAESNHAALAKLASASGGQVVSATDPAALAGAFDAIAGQLVRRYVLTYPSQAHGSSDLEVAFDAQGVRSSASVRLELPPLPPAVDVPSEPAQPAPATSRPVGTWALVAGGALCGLGLLGLGLGTLVNRTPRARGLASRRPSIGMAAVTARAEAVSERVLGSRGGGLNAVNASLEAAGLDVSAGELLVGVGAGMLVALGLGWVLMGPVGGVALGLSSPLLVRVVLDILSRRRRKRFDEQLAETLQILSGSLRAGHGLAQAIDSVAAQAESPTSEEFRRITIETRLGRDFVEAMTGLATRMASRDFSWVVQAMEIQREVGGDLAEILDTVAGTTRDRIRIRRQVSALSAEGRMSAWVLMILPFGMGAVMAATNPRYLKPLFGTSTGHSLLAVSAVLLAIGGLWLRKIVKPTF